MLKVINKSSRLLPLKYSKLTVKLPEQVHFQANIYLLKVDNEKSRTMCEICSKLTIKAPERRQ